MTVQINRRFDSMAHYGNSLVAVYQVPKCQEWSWLDMATCDSFDYALMRPYLSVNAFMSYWEHELRHLLLERFPHNVSTFDIQDALLVTSVRLRSGMTGIIKVGAYLKCLSK